MEGRQSAAQIRFDFSHMMAEYAASARANVRSALRRRLRSGSTDEREQAFASVARLSDPPGRLLKRNFVEKKEMEALSARLKYASENVQAMRGDQKRMMYWTQLPYCQSEVVEKIEKVAGEIRQKFDAFVLFGIGGSSLGPAMLQQALCDLHYNELSSERRKGPKIYIEDNIDPERMVSLLNLIDLDKTCVNVISKSGNTSETMSQYLIIMDLLKRRFGKDFASHVIVTTDLDSGNLRAAANKEGLISFEVPQGVGGRFSELCPVGLLPAAVAGIDIRALLAGAAAMDERTISSSIKENPALYAAGLQFIAMNKGMNVHVMMPYADSLRYFADWYAQLLAESLGKNVHRNNTPCAVGATPVKALGVTDQHSQVQLYTEGPEDKVITFLKVENYRASVTIPVDTQVAEDVRFLSGHTLNELIQVEQSATEYALLKSAKPSWSITIPEVTPYTMGQLLFFFEMVIAYMGELLDIDAFNQPGVEEGKNATYAMMGRAGYDMKSIELAACPKGDEEYLF